MEALAPRPPNPAVRLPPAFELVTPPGGGDAFAQACGLAPERGAGTFVWSARADVLDFAVVLEPEEALAFARRAVFAGMTALADALAGVGPPEKPVTFSWPATLLFDGARLGGGRLGWPSGCDENSVPEWLVFSAMLLAVPAVEQDPGAFPATTWLIEEGFDPAENGAVIESFASYLMLAFDNWAERGFAAVADRYLARLGDEDDGAPCGIDSNGDLLRQRAAGIERVPLLPALPAAGWYDPSTGGPRLS